MRRPKILQGQVALITRASSGIGRATALALAHAGADVALKAAAALPWGRLARPDEIARGILFLVDPGSDYLTGSTLSIDGGLQLPWWSQRGQGEL